MKVTHPSFVFVFCKVILLDISTQTDSIISAFSVKYLPHIRIVCFHGEHYEHYARSNDEQAVL